jgi:hypothetical protein
LSKHRDRFAVRASSQRLLCLLVAAIFLLAASSASAAVVHPEVNYEFGADGTSGSTISGIDSLAYNQANSRLYVLSNNFPRRVYGLHFAAAETLSALGGNFPFEVPGGSGDPQIEVDNTALPTANNIYAANDGEQLTGYTPAGAPLAANFAPTSGEKCGVAVDNAGHVWAGNYSEGQIEEFEPTGGPPIATVNTLGQGRPCHIAFDTSNGDLYVSTYGQGVFRYTAASGYSPASAVEFTSVGNAKITVDPLSHELFAARGDSVAVYNTETTNEVEEFTTAGSGEIRGIAVDDASDTVFTSFNGTAKVQEWRPITVADVTTGPPVGNKEVTGTVGLGGGGEVTECFFEFGLEAGNYTDEEACEQATPFTADESVSAQLPGLVGETTYHYRLVAVDVQGRGVGADRTITPHNVTGISTGEATEIERDSARLHASFEGNGESTSYYFEYGLSNSPYEHSSTVEDAGSPTGLTQISSVVTGLTAGHTYHYRVVATNGEGTSKAQDRTFTTDEAISTITTESATEVGTESATLNGALDPDGLQTSYYFEYGKTTSYGSKVPVPPTELGSSTPGLAQVSSQVTELSPGTTYHYRVVGLNSTGESVGGDETFTTPKAPSIISTSSRNVTAGSAELVARINPNGAETTYYFEYGPTTSYGLKAPVPADTLNGSSAEEISIELTELEGVTYHFRLVAESVWGKVVSEDQTFNFYPENCPNATVRQQTGSGGLPDCRAYELVSPENAGSTLIFPAAAPYSPTATNPSRLAYTGAWGKTEGLGAAANNLGDLYVSTRTSSGWKTKYVGVPVTEASQSGGPNWQFGRGFLNIMQSGFAEPDRVNMLVETNESMSKIVDWNDGYYACNNEFCQVVGSYEPRGSSFVPYLWDSTTGSLIERWPTGVESIPGGEELKGRSASSPDLSHYAFSSDVRFVRGAPPATLYDDNTETGTIVPISYNEAEDWIKAGPIQLSTNGSRILMSAEGQCEGFIGNPEYANECTGTGSRCPGSVERACGPGHLYMSVNDEKTYDIAKGHQVRFVSMTADGSKVYFTSEERLNGEDTDTSRDLYMWDIESPHTVTLVSKGNQPGSGNTDACSASWTQKCSIVALYFSSNDEETYTMAQGGQGGNALFNTSTASGNGDIYFLSPEELAGSHGTPGQENLYDFRNGRLQFVTALEPGGKACVIDQGGEICSLNAVALMNVSPDDSHMAFLTASRVTSYENAGYSEMYAYNPATGELACASCRPDGEPPTSNVTGSYNGPFMTNDGRTFFNTKDALVPQDTNQSGDVYEYVNGRPRLITAGVTPTNEVFGLTNIMASPGLVGVSANGTDVYFSTFDTLVKQDHNGQQLKVYDARSGGGFLFESPPPGCAAADECHGESSSAPVPPENGTGASLGSVGNAKQAKPKAENEPKHKAKKKQQKKKAKRHHRSARKGGRSNG